ncbi:MAG TPA: glycosyltransferase [Tepidisphaeraceae bacterium]
MNVIIVTIGSHGDVHPFVGLGTGLRRRGHDVTLITNPYFEKLARDAGLDFAPLGTAEQFLSMLHDPDLWNAFKGFDAVFVRGVLPIVEETYRAVEQKNIPGETVMVASTLSMGARIAQEKLGIPTASAHIAPCILRSVYDNPKLPGLFMPRWFPKWLKRWIWDGGDKYFIDPKIAPPINEFRGRLGLPPVSGIINEWWHSPQLILGLWPDWYGPPQPDWLKQVRTVGFPLFDEEGITPLSDALDEWLRAGEPPIAFTPGSAMVQGRQFFQESVDACIKLNHRGLLLTRHAEQIPQNLPDNVRHFDYAPFGTLLPRCAALVHHGGIGTTAQALRGGVPQLIMPMSHDQFDNADRVERVLGVGRSIHRRRYQSERVLRCLEDLLTRPIIKQNCRRVQQHFAGAQPIQQACDLIEKLGGAQVPETASISEH